MHTAVHNYLGPRKGPPKKGRPKRAFWGGPLWEALFGDLGSYAQQCSILNVLLNATETTCFLTHDSLNPPKIPKCPR